MRIAHVIAGMEYGGAERVVAELAVGSARSGHQVAIIARRGRLDRDWASLGIDRMLTPPWRRDPLFIGQTGYAIRTALRAWKPDIVHSHNVKATALTLAGSPHRGRPFPILSTLHGVAPHQMRLTARVLRLVDAVVAVSDDLGQAAIGAGLPPGRLELIPNGVDGAPPLTAAQRASFDRDLELSGNVVAAVGRLVPVKAHARFLEAAALVLRSRPDTTFLIIGDGPELDRLRGLTSQLGIGASVRFTGARTDARALIDRADLLVFSSLHEGHSMAALEALAAGTPVVSTDVGGMRHLLGTGAGEIVPQSDPAALAGAIAGLLGDAERRRQMGDTGRRLIAEELSAEIMVARYGRLYASTLRRAD